jgi:hypothetical protein
MCLAYNVERAVKLRVALVVLLLAKLLCFLLLRVSTEPLPLKNKLKYPRYEV